MHSAYLSVRVLDSLNMQPVEGHECDSSANLLLVHSAQDARCGRVTVNHHIEQAAYKTS